MTNLLKGAWGLSCSWHAAALIVRFLVIPGLIPMYAVLRVMHTVRDQQVQDEADRDLDQELAALLWVSNPFRALLLFKPIPPQYW